MATSVPCGFSLNGVRIMENGSWKDAIVRAGATQPAFVKEVTGLHPELFFRFRVKSPAECEKILAEIRAKTDSVATMENTVRECITEWSINAQIGAQLRHPLLVKVFWMILQNEPSDPIPESYQVPGGEYGNVEDQAKK